MSVEVLEANYLNAEQAQEITELMNAYSTDPMGSGKALPDIVKNNLVSELAKLPFAFSVIAYVDGNAAGLVNCFESFSTFSCKPLVNIHDVIILDEYRSKGLSQKMLEKVEKIAVSKGCCKLTLEVLEGNEIAKSSYTKFGFSDYQLDPKLGQAIFWHKVLL